MSWLFLLRAFFPSWRFFDDVGPELRLEVRVGPDEEDLGEWVNCLPKISRSLRNLVFNSRGNFLHGCHNLLNHLNADLQESDPHHPELFLEKTTYKLTRNLVRFQVDALGLAPASSSFFFQFRLAANYAHLEHREAEEILVSPFYASGDVA